MSCRLAKRIAGLTATGVFALASQSALALVAEVDTFTIVKNGSVLFQDTFEDNVAPPTAPGEFATYLFTMSGISEAGGKALLNAAQGEIRPNAVGALSNVTRTTFSTNIVPTETTGLKSNQAFSVSAVFSLLDDTVAADVYGLRLTDRDALGQLGVGTSGDDVVELRISHRASGARQLQFQRQNFLAAGGAIDLISSFTIPGNYFSTYDRVELQLVKSDPGSNEIEANAFFSSSNGLVTQPIAFVNTTAVFNGENWTRAELYAAQAPIPEPQTYAMLIAGLGLIGWKLRRALKK
jgi:hypothetical protein